MATLRNKKTGKLEELITCDEFEDSRCGIECHSLAQLNKEYEDYEPKEPIFKDKEVRKAIKAWLAIQENPIVTICILNCGKDADLFYDYKLYGYVGDNSVNRTAVIMEFRSRTLFEFEKYHEYYIDEVIK